MEYIIDRKQNINFQKYEPDIKERFPVSFKKFLAWGSLEVDFCDRCLAFFKYHNIQVETREVVTSKYAGTFVTTIKIIDPSTLRLLKRKSRRLDYPYHSSFEKAMYKGLVKGFRIVESLLLGKALSEKARRISKP